MSEFTVNPSLHWSRVPPSDVNSTQLCSYTEIYSHCELFSYYISKINRLHPCVVDSIALSAYPCASDQKVKVG